MEKVTSKQINMIKLMIAFVISAAFIVLGGFKADAKVVQTAEGDGSVTFTWDDESSQNYCIGYKELEGTYATTDEQNAAKAMADAGTIQVPNTQKSYTINGLKNGKQYYVCVKYTRTYGTNVYPSYSYNSYIYTKLTKPTGVNQKQWWKYILKVDVDCDRQGYHTTYDVKFMNYKGKVIETKNGLTYSAVYSHAIKNNMIYKVQVRANRTPNSSYSTVAPYSSAWSDVAWLFTQPSVTSAKVSGGKMTVKWGKISGASNYTVYVSTNNKKFKKVGTTKGSSLKIKKFNKKKFKASKTYYIYVAANKKVGKKTYTSGVNYTYKCVNGGISEGYKER